MITLGYIIQQSTTPGKWWINIPTLMGIPDNKTEFDKFKEFNEYQKKLEEQLKEPNNISKLSVFERFLYAIRNKVILTTPAEPTDEEKLFMTEAFVCGLHGSLTVYTAGDVVVVGFIDNSLSTPVILGSYLTLGGYSYGNHGEGYSLPSVEKSNIKLLSITVDTSGAGSAILPFDTKFKTTEQGNNNTTEQLLTVEQIQDAIRLLNSLLDSGLSTSFISNVLLLITTVSNLQSSLNSLNLLLLLGGNNNNSNNNSGLQPDEGSDNNTELLPDEGGDNNSEETPDEGGDNNPAPDDTEVLA